MDTPRALGTLVVVVGKARHLPNKSRFGKQDPFCSVKLGEEKQRTKAVKRGGQHPEWDEELRFTLYEDVEDTLSASASTTSLPPVPPKDGSGGILPGTTTTAELAAKSRKKGKGNKAMRVACYADDAKEPGLIGDCVVDLTEVLKTGEVEEWYVFHSKERYSGEVYLELTFFSNGRPPVRRNVPRPQVQNYGGAGTYQSSSSLSASGSVSGMSLYIPPYATPSGSLGPSGSMAGGLESLAAEVGTGAGRFGGRRESYPPPMHHHSHSLNAFPQPVPAPSHLVASSTSHELDALNRPFSSLSLSLSQAAGPATSPAPTPAPVHHPHHAHRHSMTGPPGSEAPWARFQPSGTPAPIPEYHRPSSTNPAPWDQYNAATTAAVPRPVSQASYLPPSTSYGHHQALPASLLPAAPPQSYPSSATYQSPAPQHSYAQTPPPHPSSAPPAGASQRPPSPLPPSSSHYQVPLSSFHGVQTQPPPLAPPPERHWSDPYPPQPQPVADYSYRTGSGSSAYAATPPPPPPQQAYQPGPPQSHVPWQQQTQHLANPPPVPHRVSTPSVYPSLYEQSPTGQQHGNWQQPPRAPSPQPPSLYGGPPPRGSSPAPPGRYPPPETYGSAPNSSYDSGYQQQQLPQQPYYPPPPQPVYQAPPERSYTPQPPPPPQTNAGWESQAPPPPAPAGNTSKAAWKAYMNGTGAPPASAPPTNAWYTPPPALPASIAPPEGWQSTLPHQQQRQW